MTATQQPTETITQRTRWVSWGKEAARWVAFFAMILAVRSSVASTYRVPTESMEPTILPGDRLFANQMAYNFHVPFTQTRLSNTTMPQRGDIVIFPSPIDRIRLIKRVIAIGGDTLAIHDGKLILNGKMLTYKPALGAPQGYRRVWEHLGKKRHLVQWDDRRPWARNSKVIKIPRGYFFVMGDNRDYSGDSRVFGPVSKHTLEAKAIRHFYSLGPTKGMPRLRWRRLFAPLK